MALQPGTTLGPYEIQSPIGAGGMGEVYRARDTRLERTVAIKILPAHLSVDAVCKQRFEREAKTISSLNHPHICVLYDVGHQDGTDYLVMECVEGETMAKRLEKGPLPLEQVLKFGAQIADALDKAHRRGVVHRDLKPSNIMLTSDGAKLLDFGLAKSAAVMSGATLTAVVPTNPVTQESTIVGTFHYMSPEQVEGKEVDGRSDIFSLGAVLYEMVTGKKAFDGKSQLSVASAILEKEPTPMSSLKPPTLPVLDHAIRNCLAKNPDERWQTARDLVLELNWIGESDTQVIPADLRGASKFRERAGWFVAGVLASALIGGTTWWRNSKPIEETKYFSVTLPFAAHDVAVAPNGHTIAMVGYWQEMRETLGSRNVIWLYEVGSQQPIRSLPYTAGGSYPFWSPDGKSIGFFADGKLKRVNVAGGSAQTLCDAASGRGGTWNKKGIIVFAPTGAGGALYKIAAAGGTPTEVAKPDISGGEYSYRWPVFLPDGTHFLYLAANFSGQKGVNALFVGSLDSGEKRFVAEANANAAFVAPGYLLFPREKTLFVQQFDLKRFALTEEPTAILTDIQHSPQLRRAVFAASDTSLLVAPSGNGEVISQPLWFDRHGNRVGAIGEPDVYHNVSLAPNGRTVALDATDMTNQNTDVWIYELQGGNRKRLTFDPAIDGLPIWSPDGTQLVFNSTRRIGNDLYLKNADGAQEEKCIVCDDVSKWPNDWSRDGKYILYTRDKDLWLVTIPELKPRLFMKAVSVLKNGQLSPDGKWVAYGSNESGKWQVYVTSFPDALGKWQVSTEGGEQPRWRNDGKELFYLSLDGKMMVAPVTMGTRFDSGPAAALFQVTPRQGNSLLEQFVYDVSRDGQRFLINTQANSVEAQHMTVILDWDADLKRK